MADSTNKVISIDEFAAPVGDSQRTREAREAGMLPAVPGSDGYSGRVSGTLISADYIYDRDEGPDLRLKIATPAGEREMLGLQMLSTQRGYYQRHADVGRYGRLKPGSPVVAQHIERRGSQVDEQLYNGILKRTPDFDLLVVEAPDRFDQALAAAIRRLPKVEQQAPAKSGPQIAVLDSDGRPSGTPPSTEIKRFKTPGSDGHYKRKTDVQRENTISESRGHDEPQIVGKSAAALKELNESYYFSMSVPRDEIDPNLARAMAGTDLVLMKQIDNKEHRQEALVSIGWIADSQKHYRAALHEMDAVTANNAIRAFDQERATWPEKSRQEEAERAKLEREPNKAMNMGPSGLPGSFGYYPNHPIQDTRPVAERLISPGSEGVGAASDAKLPDRRRAIPESVAARYLRVEDRFYTHDKQLAWIDGGSKLTAKSDSITTVRDFAAVAAAREWEGMTITGTDDFRRMMWREAALRGIDARGYEPSEIERAEIAKKRDERKSEPDKSMPKPAKPDRITGAVVAVGIDVPYQGRDTNKLTDYITVKQDNGREITRWGNDIGRALLDATALDVRPGRDGDGAMLFPGVIGQRVSVGDIGTQPYRASKDSEKVSNRKIFVIDSPEAYEARLAATLAEFAPAKSEPERAGAARGNNNRPENRPEKAEALAPEVPGSDGHFRAPIPTYDTMKPGEQVKLYQPTDVKRHTLDEQWWTTDKSKAERYGETTTITLPAESIAKHSALYNGRKDEFLFPNTDPRTLTAEARAVTANEEAAILATLHAAKLFADERWEHKKDRERFVLAVHRVLEEMRARGELPVPKIKERASSNTEQQRERDDQALVH